VDAFVVKVNPAGTALIYAGFLGGSYSDSGYGIAADSSGNAYVTGWTYSSNFPTVVGPDLSYNGGWDAFLAKVDPSGTALLYSGFLGGSDDDCGRGIATDSSGNAYVTGWTDSGDFPPIVGPDLSHNGSRDAFVAKVNPAGTALLYSGFLGGSGEDRGQGIAVNSSGDAYVTGLTSSPDFPAVVGPDLSFNGSWDAFVVKLNPSGGGLAYATFLGGSDWDVGHAIAVDAGGAAYLTGGTNSYDFPTTPGAFDRTYNGGYSDAFVVKMGLGGGARLSYTGPLYLPADGFMADEVDGLITTGDHVHLRLPFRNDGDQTITNASVQVCGASQTGSHIGVSIYNGTTWLNCGQTITLTPSSLAPGQAGIADFWIYVTNNDPIDRNSLTGNTWVQVATVSGQWTIRISLSPITFRISDNEELKGGSCLHHPDNFEIQKYPSMPPARPG